MNTTDEQQAAGRHRVVIIGSGFGGLFAAKALRRKPVDVTVVDRANHHLFQPLLYQVATGILSEGDIAPATRDVLRRHRDTRVELGDVTDIDLAGRELVLSGVGGTRRVGYDSLIVAAGVAQSYFGHDEFAEYAPGMKTIDDALEIRGRVFGAFEMAELESDPERRRRWLTFVIVGGGPTGVELAGQIAELSRRSLKRNFRAFEPQSANVVLLDAGDALLAAFPEILQRRALEGLHRLGVDVRLDAQVTGVDEHGVTYRKDDRTETIACETKVWAAGVEGSPLGKVLQTGDAAIELDRLGRVKVTPDCSVPGHPEVFVVGDLMALDDLGGVAEVAMQSGRHAAQTIVRRLKGRDTKPLHYIDLGTMATISRFRAVVSVGRIRIWGLLGWLMWLVVHLAFLTGFKNRFSALASWTVAFLGRDRRQRTLTSQQTRAIGTSRSPDPDR